MNNSSLLFFMVMKLTGQSLNVLEKELKEYIKTIKDEKIKKGLLEDFENFKQDLLENK